MSRVLIVSHWFYPRQNPRAFRAFELYRELNKKHDVDVLVGDWKCLLKSKDDYHDLDSFSGQETVNKNAKLSNKRIIQVGLKIVQYFIGDRYLLTSGRFLFSSIDLSRYDAVISIGLPFYVHWVVSKKLKKYKGSIVSISDWGDPFDGDPGKKIAPYFTSIQKNVCNTFDYVVTPTANAISYYKKYKKNIKNIRVIPQGFDFSEVSIDEYIPNTIPHFAYAGIFYHDKRNPEKFLDFLSKLKEDFVFTIYTIKHGPMYQDVLLKYQSKLQNKLVIHDMVPRLECIRLLSKNDFLVNIDNIDSVQVPSKLIDYSLAERPILNFKQDEVPEDTFLNFLSSDYKGQLKIDINNYNIVKVAGKFDDLICRE